MMTRTTSPRKKNPQDATLRNIRALKARVAVLEQTVRHLERLVARLGFRLWH